MHSCERCGGSTHWAMGLLGLLGLLGVVGCGPSGVVVDIGSWPSGAVALQVSGSLNGVANREPLIFTEEATRFFIKMPDGESGELALTMTAVDVHSCVRATGKTQAEVGAGLRRIAEVSTVLDAAPSPFCASPQIERITPGFVANDTPGQLTVAGQNFLSGATVTIGGVAANVVSISATSITCTAPARSAVCGTLPIVVTNPDGQVAMSSAGVSYFSTQPDFARPQPPTLGTGGFPRRVVIADFNVDGFIDLVTSDQAADGGTVYIGYGDGTFRSGPMLRTAGASTANGVVTGDFDNDRKPDVIIPNSSDNFTFYGGRGDGTFKTGVNVATGYPVGEGVAADVNGI